MALFNIGLWLTVDAEDASAATNLAERIEQKDRENFTEVGSKTVTLSVAQYLPHSSA